MSLETKKLAVLESDNCLIINPKNYGVNIELPQNGNGSNPSWIMLFASNSEELTQLIEQNLTILHQARVIWMSYPKKSGNIKSDLSRDASWKLLLPFQLSPVSQISLDDNWSSLRFKYGELPQNWVEKYLDKSQSKNNRPELIVPPELQDIFTKFEDTKVFFEGLSYTCKKEYIQYIAEAKRPETKAKRTQLTLEALLAKKKSR